MSRDQELIDAVGSLVKLKGHRGGQHTTRAFLVSVDLKHGRAVVRPAGHKKTEIVPVDRIRIWKAQPMRHKRGGSL